MDRKGFWLLGCGLSFLVASIATGTPPGFCKTAIPLNAPPSGLAYDASGVLFALEGAAFGHNEATLRTILPDGSFAASFAVVGDDASNFFVGAMGYDPVGDRLLISDNTADGRLYAVDNTGAKQTIAMNVAGIAGVAVRNTGQIFVSTAPFGSAGEVLQVNRTTGATTLVLGGLGYGAGLAFDPTGSLIVQDANPTTFQGRLQRIPMTESAGMLTFGAPEPLLAGMQSSAGVTVPHSTAFFTTGSGGLYRVAGTPLAETSFDSNGSPSQFATAIAFDPGSQPFEGFSGPNGGRLAYMADFGFASQDSFVTLLTPAEPGDYNGDGLVNLMDYIAWRGAFGTTNLAADGNRDGRVDGADYVLWREHLEQLPANFSSAPTFSVPESAPMITAFVVLASTGWRLSRNRRRFVR